MGLLVMLAAAQLVLAPPVTPAAPPATPPAAPLAAPGPDAMAIAAALLPPVDLADWRARLQSDLLKTTLAAHGVGCDETDRRCVTAAARIAARNAPIAAAAARERQQWYMAAILQDRMTPEALKSAAAYMATAPGEGFAAGLRAILNPGTLSAGLYRSMLAALPNRKTWTIVPAAEEFFEATRDLPRSRRQVPPPATYAPPVPPPPAR